MRVPRRPHVARTGQQEAAFQFLRSVNIGHIAVSLGGVETLLCHPQSTTHSGLSHAKIAESGVTDGLIRISVGIEDWRDLLSDFEQALDTIRVPVEATPVASGTPSV